MLGWWLWIRVWWAGRKHKRAQLATIREVYPDPDSIRAAEAAVARQSQLEQQISQLTALLAQEKQHLPDLVERNHIQAGDLVWFRHEGVPHSLNSFGVGLICMDHLERQLTRLCGGPVMVLASRSSPLDIETMSLKGQRLLYEKLGQNLNRKA